MSDVQKLVSLLNRVDDHLDKILCTDAARNDDTLSIVTLRLRGEIVAAIGELRAGPEPLPAVNSYWGEAFGYPFSVTDELAGVSDVPAQGGDSDVAALQEAASPHGGYVGVCGVENCPYCKTQSVGDGYCECGPQEVCDVCQGTGKQLKDAEPERPQTWRDRPPML